MNNTTLPDTTPAGLYGTLATETDVSAYVTAARKRETNTIERDDDAGTVCARTKKGTLLFSAIRKGGPGEPWILMKNPAFYPKPQLFREGSVTVRKHPETKAQFAVFDDSRAVPFEVCAIAAGPDRWMRAIVFKCVECKGDVKAGDAECSLCPVCYERAGEENERADRGE